MKIIRDYKNCPKYAAGSVVALGNFDGVHKGHIAVINKAKEIADAGGTASSVLTFEPHPINVLHPGAKPFRITDEKQKAEVIAELGIDNLFIIEFTKDFSNITATNFFKEILLNGINASHIVTGTDFVFGAGREGNTETMAALASEFNIGYSKLSPIGNSDSIFSSSLVRKNLQHANLANVRQILGRNFAIEGVVTEGKRLGNTIGFPTINIDLGDYIRPVFGVYVVKIKIEGHDKEYYGAANIGIKPTLGGSNEILEVHIFNFSEEIYNFNVYVELLEYIRGEKKFASIEELKQQITQDCITARNLLDNCDRRIIGG